MPIPGGEQNIQTPSVKETIYDTLKDWIIEGVLEPGEKISDKRLAEYFHVSKTPVREAIQILETQKLVKTFPRKETIVTEIETDNIENWYLPIIALEVCAVESACRRITEMDIQTLRQLNDAIEREKLSNDPLRVMRQDRKFHDQIIHISGNPYLWDFLDILQGHIQRLEYIFFKQRGQFGVYNCDHEEIITALRNRNEKLAAQWMQAHWLRSMERLKELLRQSKGLN